MTSYQRVYHLTSAKHALSNLENRRLKIAEYGDMNDPFECLSAELSDKRLRRAFEALRRHFETRHGVLCFSRSYRNPVLWSHYADKHKGVCLGFDVNQELLTPISYDAQCLPTAMESLLKGRDADRLAIVHRIMATKYEDWRYEDEVRAFCKIEDRDPATSLCFFTFTSDIQLKEVLLGQRFDGDIGRFRAVLTKDYPGVRAQQMRLAFRSFAVVHQLKHLKKRKPAKKK